MFFKEITYVIHLFCTANIDMIFFLIIVSVINLVAFIEILVMLSETLLQLFSRLNPLSIADEVQLHRNDGNSRSI